MTQGLLSWIIPIAFFAIVSPYILERRDQGPVIVLALVIWAVGTMLTKQVLGINFDIPFSASNEMLVYWITWSSVFGISLTGTTFAIRRNNLRYLPISKQCTFNFIAGILFVLISAYPITIIAWVIVDYLTAG